MTSEDWAKMQGQFSCKKQLHLWHAPSGAFDAQSRLGNACNVGVSAVRSITRTCCGGASSASPRVYHWRSYMPPVVSRTPDPLLSTVTDCPNIGVAREVSCVRGASQQSPCR